jgi:hypothetical protein
MDRHIGSLLGDCVLSRTSAIKRSARPIRTRIHSVSNIGAPPERILSSRSEVVELQPDAFATFLFPSQNAKSISLKWKLTTLPPPLRHPDPAHRR